MTCYHCGSRLYILAYCGACDRPQPDISKRLGMLMPASQPEVKPPAPGQEVKP